MVRKSYYLLGRALSRSGGNQSDAQSQKIVGRLTELVRSLAPFRLPPRLAGPSARASPSNGDPTRHHYLARPPREPPIHVLLPRGWNELYRRLNLHSRRRMQGNGAVGGRLYALRALGSAAASGMPGAKEALVSVAAQELSKGFGERKLDQTPPENAALFFDSCVQCGPALSLLGTLALIYPPYPPPRLRPAVKKKKAGWLGGAKEPEPAADDGSGGVVNEPHRGALSALRGAIEPAAWDPPAVRPPSRSPNALTTMRSAASLDGRVLLLLTLSVPPLVAAVTNSYRTAAIRSRPRCCSSASARTTTSPRATPGRCGRTRDSTRLAPYVACVPTASALATRSSRSCLRLGVFHYSSRRAQIAAKAAAADPLMAARDLGPLLEEALKVSRKRNLVDSY